MIAITANEIKTKGVSVFDKAFDKSDEVVINVRGKNKYVILPIQRYDDFRSGELDIAYIQTMQDIQKGNYKTQTAKEHLQMLTDAL